MARGEIHPSKRIPLPELGIDQRIDNFREVEGGYDEPSAQAEAARCLACGICSECMSCVFACGVNAIDHDMIARQETHQCWSHHPDAGLPGLPGRALRRIWLWPISQCAHSIAVRAAAVRLRPHPGACPATIGSSNPRRKSLSCSVSVRETSLTITARRCVACTPQRKRSMAKEHQPDLDIHVFMMDMRAFSKGYWGYFERARDRYGIHYHRCRISALTRRSSHPTI